jgi:hypothetical protein
MRRDPPVPFREESHMARHNEDDWEDDPENWAPEDGDGETIPCPYCSRMIAEDTPRCPYCETYITEEDTPSKRKPWWVILGAVACIVVFYFWIRYG